MCGIAAAALRPKFRNEMVQMLLDFLRALEYRGYDSAGIGVYDEDSGRILIWKKKGKVESLARILKTVKVRAPVGVAHTRWATHGVPSDVNAHPHTDCRNEVAVVHNGIISNYKELRERLEKLGHKFVSDTDTEVVAHLFEEYSRQLPPFEAFEKTIKELQGYYAIVMITSKDPKRVYFARKESPLVMGRGSKGYFLSSDVVSLLGSAEEVAVIEDGEYGWISEDDYLVTGKSRKELNFFKPSWTPQQAMKGHYEHFMLKEIYEGPTAVRETIVGILSDDNVFRAADMLEGHVVAVAAGTSYHAALIFSYLYMKLTGKYIITLDASEAPHYERLLRGTVIAVSQSGETYDTLKAVRIAKKNGAKIIGVVNVLGSTLDRESDISLRLRAGPEIGVAATKTFLAQLTMLYALTYAKLGKDLEESLKPLPEVVGESLDMSAGYVKALANKLYQKRDMYVLGTGISNFVAMEIALKIKEISYIHAEAYPAGEAKHGPISLAEEGFPVLMAWTPEDEDKLEVAAKEFSSRGSEVYWIGPRREVPVPDVSWELVPFAVTPPGQLLSYYLAVKRGLDPDKPRNLAKSVTVH